MILVYSKQEDDDDHDDDDFSGPALGGHVSMRSDSDNEDDVDEPPMMGNLNILRSSHLSVLNNNLNKKPFSI